MHASVTGLAKDHVHGRSLTDDSVSVDFSLHLGPLSFSSYTHEEVQLCTLFLNFKRLGLLYFTPESS